MFKWHFFMKGIKRNALRNAIDVNFLLWTHIKILKVKKFNLLGYKEKDYSFRSFWLIFIFTKFNIYNLKCGSHVQEIIIPKKCEIFHKCLFKHFMHF